MIVYSEYIYYQLVLGGALDGAFADYPTPTTDIPAPETALQVNTTATAISGGQVIYEGLSTGGTIAFTTDDIQKLVIPGDTTPITLVLGTYSPITTSAVAVLRMREEW